MLCGVSALLFYGLTQPHSSLASRKSTCTAPAPSNKQQLALAEAMEPAALLPSLPGRKHFVSSSGWHLKAGYLSGRRLPEDVLSPDPDTPALCTAGATEQLSLRRQGSRRSRTQEVPQGHLSACPGTGSMMHLRWTFWNATAHQ